MSYIPTPSALEVDFHRNITDLYKAITGSDWEGAIRAVKKNPSEAKTWVVRKYDDHPEKTMWRFLPIHSACARQPPAELIAALIAAYPEGARCVDDQGMYALHYASGNQASRDVMRSLLLSFPDAAKLKDPRGMLPIHYVACWGPSSLSIVDMVMVANRNVGDCRDEDGNTPMDMARDGDYPEKNAVVAALRRWSNTNGVAPTLLTTPHNGTTTSSSSTASSVASAAYKEIGRKFEALSIPIDQEEKKSDDDDFLGPHNSSYDGTTSSCISPGTVRKIHDMDDHISVMEIESKEDKLEISMLMYELKQRNEMIEKLKTNLTVVNDECNGLRTSLADVTEQHEGLANMNSSLLAMVEQQEIVLKATRAREEQWEKLAAMRRERLRELVQMEEEDTFLEVDLRNTLAKQAHEMAAIKAEISTTLGGSSGSNGGGNNGGNMTGDM